ncbi:MULTISPECIES: hypothetical protein [unclassified Archaeoglobus]|jgi:hypothetical protein|uniref:hypothetical protein n=1 Tax=unclassified Archaeoglobus TaxID=2643606 RepID=UPI0025C5CABF|nr:MULTISPECIES: hypothetical protein [unclassified Archaeoglobus]
MSLKEFEEEVRNLFDADLVERAKNLKKSGNIFNPIFYIYFTRLVELSAIINGVVLPNRYEIEELFRTRKDFLQIDYGTIGEVLRRAWLFERERGVEFTFSNSVEDMLYILYRMGKLQGKLDGIILKYAEWSKEKLAELYFTILLVLLELEDRINREIQLKKP